MRADETRIFLMLYRPTSLVAVPPAARFSILIPISILTLDFQPRAARAINIGTSVFLSLGRLLRVS